MVGSFTGAVLTGGSSRRMGRDKALLDVGGRPLAGVALDALRAAGASEVLAIGGDSNRLGPLGFTLVADDHPGAGPLGGVVTALAAATDDVAVVLACDLPSVSAAAVTAVLAALGDGHDAAVPEVDGRRQVLLAAYRRSCLPVLTAALAAGERALHRSLAHLAVAQVVLADPAWAADVDTPADLAGR